MTREIKPPVVIAVLAVALILALLFGYRSITHGAEHHEAFVYTKLTDLVRQERTDPSKLTPEQRKYLAGLPPQIKQRAIDQASR